MALLFYIFYSLVYNGFSLRAKGVGSPSRERSTEILLPALPRSHWGQLGRLAYPSRPIFYIHQDEGTHCHSQESHPRPPGHRQDHQPQLILLGRKRRSCKIHAHGLRPHAAEPEDEQSPTQQADPKFSAPSSAALLICKPRRRGKRWCVGRGNMI